MNKTDKALGMDRPISRRDLLQGALVAASGIASPSLAKEAFSDNQRAAKLDGPTNSFSYPPALDGLRGNHQGSFEISHALARYGQTEFGNQQDVDELYDLVVVGAGISGLAAAYFYRQKHPDARILILDNHDDFGGHAKRNEFEVNGRTVLGYGGAQTMQEPSGYSAVVKGLLRDLDIEVNTFDTAYDSKFYRRNKLAGGVHFDKKRWGKNTLINYDLIDLKNYIPLHDAKLPASEAVAEMPISDAAKQQMLFLLQNKKDLLRSEADKWDYLRTISYRDFLVDHVGITEPDVFAVLQDLAGDSGVGIESINAGSALWYAGLPGWDSAGLGEAETEEPYIHHFPDGNASVARQLVRRLIPAVAPGQTMESLMSVVFDYNKLDDHDAAVRLRLNSTVVNVKEGTVPGAPEIITLSYVRQGTSFRVRTKATVLACNNGIIPYICPQLPEAQKKALAFQVKSPILYTNVALTNWRAWKNLGLGAVVCPTGYHVNAMIDFPVSYGDYKFSSDPDQPVVIHMERFPHLSNAGLTAQEQYREGRRELIGTSFGTIERNVRIQLQDILGQGGFNAAEDIAGITVNRWAHGYAYYYNSLYDDTYDDDEDPRYPHVMARKPLGSIVIANSDAGASAMMESAIEQAHRAVGELK